MAEREDDLYFYGQDGKIDGETGQDDVEDEPVDDGYDPSELLFLNDRAIIENAHKKHSHNETTRLVETAKDKNNPESAECSENLLRQYEPLVCYIVDKYYPDINADFRDDVLQEGRLGIIDAIENFPKDYAPSTWINFKIKRRLHRYYMDYCQHEGIAETEMDINREVDGIMELMLLTPNEWKEAGWKENSEFDYLFDRYPLLGDLDNLDNFPLTRREKEVIFLRFGLDGVGGANIRRNR